MEKSHIAYDSLVIPAEGMAPRLLLEWMASRNKKMPIKVKEMHYDPQHKKYYEKTSVGIDGTYDVLVIVGLKEQVLIVREYINSNL
jgi:hypothetical protein